MKNNMKKIENESTMVKVSNFINKHIAVFACLLLVGIMATGVANAAEGLWTQISNLIQTWVTRLGGVVMFVGGVMFGLGWKSDDAEQKSRGISTIIAGAIVVAVAALTSTFFA